MRLRDLVARPLTRRAAWTITLAGYAANALLFFPLHARVGDGAGALVFGSAALAGLLLGARAGLVGGVCSLELNHVLFALAGATSFTLFAPADLLYGTLVIGIGGALGRLRDLGLRLRAAADIERTVRESAEQSEARWRGLLESAPGTVSILDKEGRILFVNKPGAPGLKALEGRSAYDTCSPADAAKIREQIARVCAERTTVQFETQTDAPAGGTGLRWMWVSAGPLIKDGEIESVIFFTNDITDKKRQEEALRHTEKFATLGSLSAGVAHEINNPLAFMGLETEMFMAQMADAPPGTLPDAWRESAERFARTNKQGIDRVAKIVQSLRILSKPEIEPRTILLRPILDATATLAHTSLRSRSITLDVAPDVAAFAVGDHVGQIALNLIINAADAAPPTGGKIHIEANTTAGRTVLRVTDNGHGIPHEARSRIFTPFYTTKKKGTGLGLAICKRLAEEGGGSLRFEDAPGGGTTFTLDLPALAPDPPRPAPMAVAA